MSIKLISKIHIKLEFIVVLILMCILKNKIYFISYTSLIMHELGHILLILHLKKEINYINVCGFGLECNVNNLSNIYEKFLVKLAGPLINLIIAIVFIKFETIFNINMALFLINMLPIKPLDGYGIMELIFLNRSKKVVKFVDFSLLLLAYIISTYFFIKFSNFYLLIFIICVTIKNVQAQYLFCNN